MKKNFWQRLSVILMFGSVWGILEASLGYVLHLLPALIAGSVMFPIASVILLWAYKSSQKKSDLVWIGFVAALIKGIDFFLPNLSYFKVMNPMIAIVFETLMVVAVIPLLEKSNLFSKICAMPLAALGWNLLFLNFHAIYYIVNLAVSPDTAYLNYNISSVANFLSYMQNNFLLSGILAAGLVFLFTYLVFPKMKPTTHVAYWLSTSTFALGLALTVVFTII
ncbi:MAG TPA: hypothetical protein PLH02_04145 [Bacillota bacterium]|nr:hypothetical protein [Bacillota bacterium]HPF42542.1 hypothetical protein [Bacillota bacterium]HPJ86014.1 hypothetical protein [Bacillota bacterium]HPQ62043.1 hypothetical protein [Bacillota bacterium]HRX91555.1 hypothetical protein [Candidatus Izemoplasmatales bacterium]